MQSETQTSHANYITCFFRLPVQCKTAVLAADPVPPLCERLPSPLPDHPSFEAPMRGSSGQARKSWKALVLSEIEGSPHPHFLLLKACCQDLWRTLPPASRF